jgi:hypothetical protein
MTEDEPQAVPEYNENTYRIRATVRALMSPGMWLVVTAQAVTLILFSFAGNQDSVNKVTPIYAVFSFFVFLFVTSGMFRSLATGSGVVSVKEVLTNAPLVFGRFLMLGLKIFFLFLFLFYFVLVFLGGGLELLKTYPWVWGMVLALVTVALVYWLPIVFVTDRFELAQTLISAIHMQQKRLPQLPFIAILLLTPTVLGLFLNLQQGLLAVVSISVLSEILGWIAYTYCIEYVVRHKDQALVNASM